jgi:hypothetical protein
MMPSANESLIIIIEGIAFTTLAFMRRRFGDKFVGLQAGVALVFILLFGAFFPGHDLRPLMGFLAAYVVMCAWHNLSRRQGLKVHSRYSGIPRLQRFFKRASEETIKARHEPVLILVLGGLISLINVPLGALLLWSAIAITMNEITLHAAMQNRLREMNDQYIEQRCVLDRFRHERGDSLN